MHMKKITGILVISLLIFAALSPTFTAYADPVAKSVRLESENGDVAIRATDDIANLTDGNKVLNAEGKNDFNIDGIVLIQNKKANTPNCYPTCNLIIDLGTEKKVNTVNIAFFHYYDAIIDTPKDGDVTISYSIDGDGFAEIGTYKINGEASSITSGIFDENISLGKTVSAKEIMVSMSYGNYPLTCPVAEWFGFTELSAGISTDYIHEESSQVSVEESKNIEPDVYGDLYVTQINKVVDNASGAIFTRGYEFVDNVGALDAVKADLKDITGFITAPTDEKDVFIVTQKIKNVESGSIIIPEGGFIYCAHFDNTVGNDWYKTSELNLTSTAKIKVGDKLKLNDVDFSETTLGDKPGIDLMKNTTSSDDNTKTSSDDNTNTLSNTSSDDENSSTNSPSESPSSDELQPKVNNSLWINIGVIVGAIVIVAIVCVIYIKKRKD